MQRIKGLLSIIGLTLMVSGFGQSATDHPNLKSGNSRTGSNGNVSGSMPGYLRPEGQTALGVRLPSALRWFTPQQSAREVNDLRLNEINPFRTLVDNTDFVGAGAPLTVNVDEAGNPVGPFDPLPNGFVTSTGAWNAATSDQEANFPYSLYVRRNRNAANPVVPVDYTGRNFTARFPSHTWTPTTASAASVGGDPRIAAVPANLRTWTWAFTPRTSTNIGTASAPVFTTAVDNTPKSYALYVWIPVGPIRPTPVTQRFSARYYVYEITYAGGQKYVDVVDTFGSGGGYVRLGNGGRQTNQVFPYDGTNPIRITLYNTIPRNDNDQLLETVDATNLDDRFAVYADAALFSAETDSYTSTPTSAGFGTLDIRVTGARNERLIDPTTIPLVSSTNFKAKPVTVGKGVVTSYDYNTGNVRWKYSPLESPFRAFTFEETGPQFATTAGVTAAVDNPLARAVTHFTAPMTNAALATENVTVAPDTDLLPGAYEIQMYVAGDVTLPAPINYATRAEYEIIENGASVGTFTIDLSGPAGWKRIGTRRYEHSVTNQLVVRMTNRSALAADAARLLYVDQFRYIASSTTEFTSTPVHARAFVRLAPAAAPVETNVVIVADERGRIHCLDAAGSGDGTTTCYWTYPSERVETADPNLSPGRDINDPTNGVNFQTFDGTADTLSATMPTRFDLSTAVVHRQTITAPGPTLLIRDFLVIGSENGRVYSIAMEGRGDHNAPTDVHGTTFRTWTYPDMFPTAPEQPTKLGAITSVVQSTATVGGVSQPVVFVGTEQGRMHCLAANGDFNYSGTNNLSTTVLWQYPPATSNTLAPISGAPIYDATANRLFFGTEYDDDKLGSKFISMDVNTGTVLWDTVTDAVGAPGIAPRQLDWLSGAAYVSQPQLTDPLAPGEGSALALTTPECIYAMNQNGWVYAINATTGQVVWRTNELQAGGQGSLIFSHIITQGKAGALATFPVVFVPTAGGHFAALFARLDEETRFAGPNPLIGNRRAWGYQMNDAIQASMTVSNRWLYGATSNGYLYAWSDVTNAGSFLPPGLIAPGSDIIPDNNQDSLYEDYRNAEVAFLSREGYLRLRKAIPGGSKGFEAYGNVIDGAMAYTKPLGRLRAPFRSTHGNAYEWGETIYMVVYNFPVRTTNANGDDVPPPIVEANLTTEGRPGRPVPFESRLFSDKNESDPDGGYAVFQIPLTSGGSTAQVPGPGSVKVNIRTGATNVNGSLQSITLNPALTALDYQVANPLGIVLANAVGTLTPEENQLGNTVDANREDALLNGSADVALSLLGITVRGSQLGQSTGLGSHGGSKRTTIQVLDRSLITLQRGEGRGLENVRVDRRDLRWQGGGASVAKPFASMPAAVSALFNSFEDLPVNYPNTSLDYPDVRREQVKIRKEATGNVENPVFSGVTLKGPRVGNAPVLETTAAARSLVPTKFEFQVDLPRYQPVNVGANSIANQANSTSWFAGYAGRFTIFVDSDQDNRFGGTIREAYRSFNLASAVAPDTKIVVGTPSVDLGSMSAGAGYDTALTYTAVRPYRVLSPTSIFAPYSLLGANKYDTMFKSFSVFNEGNLNLLNVRLAKGSAEVTGGGISLYWPWQLLSQSNNDQIWLDSATDVHTDIDRNFSPTLGATALNYVVVQKPRVGDSRGRQLQVNPSSRINSNLPGSGSALNTAANMQQLQRDPRIAVTPPIGTPVGQYSQTMRVIEDNAGNGPGAGFNDESLSLGYLGGAGNLTMFEGYSDPTFTVSFRIKETQLTGGRSANTEAIIHEGYANAALTQATPAQWSDVQPTGVRRNNGNVLMAFSSNRPIPYPLTPNPNPASRNYGIFISRLTGAQMGAADARGEDSWLRDLNKFAPDDPANQRWAGYSATVDPTIITTLFGNTLVNGVPNSYDIGGTVVPTENRLSNPAFPSNGDRNLNGTSIAQLVMAFVGETKRTSGSGLTTDSRIMVSRVSSTGAVAADPDVLDFDPAMRKGRPSLVQNGRDSAIFFAGQSNGASAIFVTNYVVGAGFGVPVPIRLGKGFESVSDPSATMHLNAAGLPEITVVFSARLRGSGVNEVFTAKFLADAALVVNTTPLSFGVAGIAGGDVVETLVYDSRMNGYRSRGVNWASNGPFTLRTTTPTFTDVARIASGTSVFADAAGLPTATPVGTVDRETGLQSYPTIFGGRVVVDTSLGLVKFTSTQLPKSLQITLTYVPTALRLSANTAAGYSAPSALFDRRLAPSNTAATPAFWFTPAGLPEPANSANTLADRLLVAAVRGTAAGGQTSRPVMSTFRYGVRVGRAILTNNNGTLAEAILVNGVSAPVGSYQVDPVSGRILFAVQDQNKTVRIRIGAGAQAVDIVRPITIVGESAEEFVPMENALNEANFGLFMDPVGDIANRRELIWMIWSSSRSGAPNLFFQTMARKLTPFATGN